jgi:uncharacterized iron-regulated membrane protein
MNLKRLNRKVHYWAGMVIALPVLVIISSGLLLQIKKQWTWVQPSTQRGRGASSTVNLEGILASVRGAPDLGVTEWQDVDRLDVRPRKGIVKVRLKSGWEVQVDLGTGRVLQTAYRRSDIIESIHDGSFFVGDWSKLGLFFPTGIALLILWVTGVWMLWHQLAHKPRRANSSRVRRDSMRSD